MPHSMAELLAALLLLGLSTPVSAKVSKHASTAYICFGVFIFLFIMGALYVRQRRTWRSYQPRNSNAGTPAPVSAWAKAAPPKDNGKAGVGPGVAAGEWERDA